MEYIIIFVVCMITILVLKFAFQVKIKDVKIIKKIGYDKDLNEITNVLPENKIVCEVILKKLKNEGVTVQETEDANKTLTYYSVMTNHIVIANIKDTFTRIQTIAHECLHSVQNRNMLYFNFIFSNIYILYFVAISILTLCKLNVMPMLQVVILILLGSIYYAIRSYLETDAMTKAPYVAKEYMEEEGTLSKTQIETIMQNYKVLNQIGIPMTNFGLIWKIISKVMIYCVIVLLVGNF